MREIIVIRKKCLSFNVSDEVSELLRVHQEIHDFNRRVDEEITDQLAEQTDRMFMAGADE